MGLLLFIVPIAIWIFYNTLPRIKTFLVGFVEMVSTWIPIVSKRTYEPFVDESQTQSIVGNVFIGVGLMILATILTVVFYWSYNKEKLLFITILCVVVFIFSVKMIILVAALRTKMNPIIFRLYMGSTTFMSMMSLILIIYFAVKTSQRLRGSSSSSYIPPQVQAYASSSSDI